jgi:hypothetical protein
MSESLRDRRVGSLYTAAFEGQEAATRVMFERAIARGELRPDFRMDLAITWFAGLLVLYAVIERPLPEPSDADDLIDFLLEGIAAR